MSGVTDEPRNFSYRQRSNTCRTRVCSDLSVEFHILKYLLAPNLMILSIESVSGDLVVGVTFEMRNETLIYPRAACANISKSSVVANGT